MSEQEAPAQQTSTPETATPPAQEQASPEKEAAKPEQDLKFASKFAALSKKERDLLKKSQEIKAKESQLQEWERLKGNAKTDVDATLKALGLDYDTVTEFYLNGGAPKKESDVEVIKKKLTEIEQRDEQRKKEAEQAKLQEQLANFQNEQVGFVKKHAEKYELINVFDAHDLVFQVTQEYYESKGTVPTHEEAANLVEKYLEQTLEKLPQVKKAQRYFAPKTEPEKQNQDKPVQKTQTLTNNLAQNVPAPDGKRPLTREESIERAARMIRFQ